MKKFLYKVWAKFLTHFAEVKIFKFPMFIVYDPHYFDVGGEQVLDILNTLKPGDIILRGYDCYLDSKFIPDPLDFSHGGIYIGDGKIIHAVAEGASYTNAIEFTRCDRIAIFRPRKYQKSAIKKAKEFAKNNVKYDFGFNENVSALYCFELCGLCYEKLDIPRFGVKKFLGLVRKNNVFLSKSFFSSPDMKCIYHYNPKFNINTK